MIDPSLPLIDLHRHLDGNVRLQTIIDLAEKNGISLPAENVDSLRPYVVVNDSEPGLMAFIARFKYLTSILVDGDACRRVAYENVEDAAREGIDYVELRFSPWFMASSHGLNPAIVLEAIVDGVAAGARDTGVKVQLIGILSRTYGVETAFKELAALLQFKQYFAALDLAGDEAAFPAGLFTEHFRRARDAGLAITVHAGESDGPESIWSSINDLGASRIGHGVSAAQDPALMDYLLERQIGLEISLTSNIHTQTIDRLENHPAKSFFERGMLASLNTDDPAISGIDLIHEYQQAAPAAGLTAAMTRQSQLNAVQMAFLSVSDKQALMDKKRPPPSRRGPS